MNSHCFKIHRKYSISVNLSIVGEIFWSLFRENRIYVSKTEKENFVLCSFTPKSGRRKLEISCRSRATTAKKCTETRDARAKLIFCQSTPIGYFFAVRRRRYKNSPLLSSKNFATMVT